MAVSIATAAPAQASTFLAGAGEQITTPPPAGSADAAPFSTAFSTLCPKPVFPAAGRFALQEPFNDLNGNGQWDSGSVPEPYCDANGNGRWDGIYADNGNGPATGVHDNIDVRAVAISDGRHRPVVYASVDQIGIFDYYTEAARADLKNTYGIDADLVVSADHNESSPDSIGLYGALQTPAGVGIRSGIDEYYMSFLEDRIAHAAADAVHTLQPAALFANQVEGAIPDGTGGNRYPLLSGMSQRISDQFPTSVATAHDDRVAAVDTKLGVLQARRPDGTPIFTVMSLAAHNQEMGNSGSGLSGDWPAAFERSFDSAHPGVAMFLVGDNGSEEDPQTEPAAIPNGSENHTSQATQYVQVQATGARFAQITAGAAAGASPLSAGSVQLVRRQICVPLENNGFVALAAAGVFGKRQGYVCDASGNPVAAVPNGLAGATASTQFRTYVAYTDIGPDMELIDNPGEAFPALMLGSPFGVEDESCNRPNAAVPTWRSHALYRFQVGLADDLIGYLIPAWAFASGTPGLFNNDSCYQDEHGHGHKLESESVGPTGANDVANALASMLGAQGDPSARIGPGRFVLPNGTLSRWPEGAAGIMLPDPGKSVLDAGAGTLIGAPATAGFGGRAVDANGLFMDYDGQPQSRPDVTTRGMMVLDANGCVAARYYLDVFPTLATGRPLGGAVSQPSVLPGRSCPFSSRNGVPEIQRGASLSSGLARAASCSREPRPTTSVARRRVTSRGGRLRLAGKARAFACARVARITITVIHRNPKRGGCRYLKPNGRLGPRRTCGRPIMLLARGRARWSFAMRLRLPRGRYTVVVRAIDTHGVAEAGGRRADTLQLMVR